MYSWFVVWLIPWGCAVGVWSPRPVGLWAVDTGWGAGWRSSGWVAILVDTCPPVCRSSAGHLS